MTAPTRIDPENLPEGDAKVAAVRAMFDTIAPRYDVVNRLLTFRMDVGWRRRTVSSLGLVPGAVIADLACGTGDLCGELEGSGFLPLGFDLSFGMLDSAPRGFPRAQADALSLPLGDGSMDGATCGFALRNFVALEPFFAEVSRVVRRGGRLAFLEVAQPPNAALRLGHSFYFERVVPLIGGMLSDPSAYRYLPKSVAYLPAEPRLVEMIEACGWRDVRHRLLSGGIAQLITATQELTMAVTVERVDSAPTEVPPDVAFVAPRRSMRGWGAAAVVEIAAPWVENTSEITAALRRLGGDLEPPVVGTGAVAFASLPFDRDSAARIVVPQVLWTRLDDGTQYVSRFGPADAPDTALPATPVAGGVRPREVSLRADQRTDEWCAGVAAARDAIRRGELDKVVLARHLVATADRPWDAAQIFDRLSTRHPRSYRYLIDGFVGASPELLVSRIGDVVRARPMAGTLPRTGLADRDAAAAATLMASEKNRAEHAITIDAVHDALLEWCSYLDSEPTPHVVDAGSVQHLATPLEGRLHDPRPDVAELVAALHPTPAVGGHPRAEALRVIAATEPFPRGAYAGPVGWSDVDGNGSWAVGIRGATIDGHRAHLCAGVGVVADSDPELELAETRAKFAATTGAFVDL